MVVSTRIASGQDLACVVEKLYQAALKRGDCLAHNL